MPLPAYFLRFITAENQVFCPDSTETHTLPSGSREQKQTLSHSLLHTQSSFTLRGAPGIVLGFVLWRWSASSCSSQAWSSLPPVFSLSPWVLTSSVRFVCVWSGGFFWVRCNCILEGISCCLSHYDKSLKEQGMKQHDRRSSFSIFPKTSGIKS